MQKTISIVAVILAFVFLPAALCSALSNAPILMSIAFAFAGVLCAGVAGFGAITRVSAQVDAAQATKPPVHQSPPAPAVVAQPELYQAPAPLPDPKKPTANIQALPQQWEYFTCILPIVGTADPNEKLNQMGAIGWELVGVNYFNHPLMSWCREFYFKRPKREVGEPDVK